MPDSWETGRKLDPKNPDDHAKLMPSGYTAIEEYSHELAEKLLAAGAVGHDDESATVLGVELRVAGEAGPIRAAVARARTGGRGLDVPAQAVADLAAARSPASRSARSISSIQSAYSRGVV